MCDLPCKVFLETLEQAAVYLEAGGAHMAADRVYLIAEAIYRRPDIFEMLQVAMTDVLVEQTKLWQEQHEA